MDPADLALTKRAGEISGGRLAWRRNHPLKFLPGSVAGLPQGTCCNELSGQGEGQLLLTAFPLVQEATSS